MEKVFGDTGKNRYFSMDRIFNFNLSKKMFKDPMPVLMDFMKKRMRENVNVNDIVKECWLQDFMILDSNENYWNMYNYFFDKILVVKTFAPLTMNIMPGY